MQKKKPASLGLREAVWGRIPRDQYRGNRFVVFGTKPLDDLDAILAVSKAIVADDQIRL